MIKHVLVGTDGSPAALHAVETAAEIADRFGAKLTMAYVRHITPVSGFGDLPLTQEYLDLDESEFEKTRRIIIERSRGACDKLNLKFDCVVVRGAAGDGLVDLAKSLKIDLIVVGHRGLSALQTFFLGSTAEHVVKAAKCSVLVVR